MIGDASKASFLSILESDVGVSLHTHIQNCTCSEHIHVYINVNIMIQCIKLYKYMVFDQIFEQL